MNVWAKVLTALCGGLNEAGEAIADDQALRILDQELREAAEAVKHSKADRVAVMAHQRVAEEKCNTYAKQIDEYEGYARQALDKKDESLALDIAQKIAELESTLLSEKAVSTAFKVQTDQLRTTIKLAEANIKRLKQQIDTVKATESVQRAQEALAMRHGGSNSKLRTAMDSLERIKARQTMQAAKMKAEQELAEEDGESELQARLQKAGITPSGASAKAVLERLRN